MADAGGEEGQTGRHPVREKAKALGTETPEAQGGRNREVSIFKECEGNVERETLLTWSKRRESPRGQKAQESTRSRSELILRRQRGARLFQWAQAVGAPVRSPEGFCRKAPERTEIFERMFRSLRRSKAL